ncbi:MAG: hypothetical protein NC217_04585 [Muribaculaceae bacterium]|nr:hypothetical protein [Muribaculaceae bacterium]
MWNLKDALFEVADRAEEGRTGTVVLRLDLLVSFDAAQDFLTSLPGARIVLGRVDNWVKLNDSDEPMKLLVANLDTDDKDAAYSELQTLAKERNTLLVFLEMLSDLRDDDFEDAEVIACRTEFALTVGELYDQLNDSEISDNIAVYQESINRVTFVEPETHHPGHSNQHFTTVNLDAGTVQNAVTVREFANFLKGFDRDAVIEIDGEKIIDQIVVYGGNVTAFSTMKASELSKAYSQSYTKSRK